MQSAGCEGVGGKMHLDVLRSVGVNGKNAASLPWTVSVADASALPTMFSATQV